MNNTNTKISKYMNEIKELCFNALRIDSGQHKQWYLEEILKLTGYNIKKDEVSWDRGIPP